MDLATALSQIGFTDYEARAYLALLGEHPVTGYQVSKRSGVPRSMVYETLSRLRARGAVLETIEGRATLYRPLPPDVLLERLEEHHRSLIHELRVGLDQLYAQKEEGRIWSIQGQPAVQAYAVQMIREATVELATVLNDFHLDVLKVEIQDACDRGLQISALLTGEGHLDCGEVVRHPPLESELQGLTDTLLVVADRTEVLVSSAQQETTTATITRSPDLVLIARQFVWMELFTQRVYARLGAELLARLDPQDRQIFESLMEDSREGNPT